MNDLISRQALCEYALNQKDKSVTPNDIMRFPSAQPDVTDTNVGDTIYREEAIKKIAEHLGIPAENWMKIAEEWLRDAPSAQPEKMRGGEDD